MIKTFQKNMVGSDFVVGDIHGCFSSLEEELDKVSFDESTDRLFSVGDLVDRGPESERCLEFLSKPWFHSIMGNHENMAIQYSIGIWPENNYILNGGKWFVDASFEERVEYIKAFTELPIAIEILDSWNTGNVGLVHAECPYNNWYWFKEELLKDDPEKSILETCLWDRVRITCRDQEPVKHIDRIFVGHTPVRSPAVLGNHVYIDTGAVFGRELTLIQL